MTIAITTPLIATTRSLSRCIRALAIPAAVLVSASLFASEASAAPSWGEFSAGNCVDDGLQVYSAILWNIPWGQSWENACWDMDATVENSYYAEPDNCVNTGLNMWGQFYVPNADCMEGGVPPACIHDGYTVICHCDSPHASPHGNCFTGEPLGG